MSKNICVDAGHAGGNIDPGAVGNNGTQEADINLSVSKGVATYLQCAGLTSVMTRTQPEQAETDDLYYRVDIAEKNNADLFISIHANSAENSTATGIETWYFDGSEDSKCLAECIQRQLVNSLGLVDRGVKATKSLYVLKHTSMPAVLVELGFLSNAVEEEFLADIINQDTAAKTIARGVTDYLTGV